MLCASPARCVGVKGGEGFRLGDVEGGACSQRTLHREGAIERVVAGGVGCACDGLREIIELLLELLVSILA